MKLNDLYTEEEIKKICDELAALGCQSFRMSDEKWEQYLKLVEQSEDTYNES